MNKIAEATRVRVCLPIRFEDEDMPYDFPLRQGDTWTAIIDIVTGVIEDWPVQEKPKELFEKVVDGGIYTLLNDDGEELVEICDYVPHGLIPGEWGDYVNLKISPDGRITNWPKSPDLDKFYRGNRHDRC